MKHTQKSIRKFSFKLPALSIFKYFKFLYVGRPVLNYYAKHERDPSTSLFTTAVETSRPQWYSANFLQKQYRMQVAADMLDRANSDPTFMGRIITGDETWIYEYDTLTSQQSSEWVGKNEPKPKKPRQSRSKIKKMLVVFFDIRGVVHHEFVSQGQTVNKDFYLTVLRHLRANIRRKRPDLW